MTLEKRKLLLKRKILNRKLEIKEISQKIKDKGDVMILLKKEITNQIPRLHHQVQIHVVHHPLLLTNLNLAQIQEVDTENEVNFLYYWLIIYVNLYNFLITI